MKKNTKIIAFLFSGSIAVASVVTGAVVFSYSSYNRNKIDYLFFNPQLAKQAEQKTPPPAPIEPKPKEPEPEKPIENKPAKPVVPPTTQPPREEAPAPNTDTAKKPDEKIVTPSPVKPKPQETENDTRGNSTNGDSLTRFKDFDEYDVTNIERNKKDKSLQILKVDDPNGYYGGYGTTQRRGYKYHQDKTSATFDKNASESTETLSKLYNQGFKFKRLTKQISSDDFKYIKENTLIYTGEKVIQVDEKLKKEALDYWNTRNRTVLGQNPSDPTTKESDYYPDKKELDQWDLDMLAKGWFPVSRSTWALRPGFVNSTVFKILTKNKERFLPYDAIQQRGTWSTENLEYINTLDTPNTGWKKTIRQLGDYDQNNIQLLEYTNIQKAEEKRYMIEVKIIERMPDLNEAIEAAKKQINNSGIQHGIGLVLRNINKNNLTQAGNVLAKFPNFIRKVTLFYFSNNPSALNEFKKNPNFSSSNQLYELEINTEPNKAHIDESERILSSVDPEIFKKIRDGAYDHNSSVVFTKWEFPAGTLKSKLSDIFKYVYIEKANRRVFQGSFGEGGYVARLDLSNTEIFDLNNIVIPTKIGKFSKVYFPETFDGRVVIDLKNVSKQEQDNTGRILTIEPFQRGEVFYGKDPSNVPQTLVINSLSVRGKDADKASIQNILNYSQNRGWDGFKELDLSSTSFTEAEARTFTGQLLKKVIIKVNGVKKTITL